MKNKILIIYGSLNSVPSPEGAAPAKIIYQTVTTLKDNRFCVLSNWNSKLKKENFNRSLFLFVKPNWVDKYLLFLLKLKYSYKKRKELFITAQDNQLLYFIAVCRFVRKHRYQKIIVHVAPGLVMLLKKVFPKKDIIFYHHGTSLHTKLNASQWEQLLTTTKAIFGVNKIALQLANKTFQKQCSLEKYIQIDNAITPLRKIDNFQPKNNCKVFVFVGRICKEKGVLNLIKAFKLVENPYSKLIVIGGAGAKGKVTLETSYIADCKSFVKENNLNVTFTGFLSGDDLLPKLLEADAMIMSTDTRHSQEGMPLAILEAFSLGLPVISTNSGGCVEVVKHLYNGILVGNSTNFKVLAENIDLLINDVKLYQKLSQNAYITFLEKHTYKTYCNKFMNALEQSGFINV